MISLNWVKDYISLDENPNSLADKVTKAGINIEKVITNHIDNLVIGEVISCENHPDSDHLHVCKVNVGEEIQIVCGAPNVREGLKVIVALPGCKLPDIEIKKGNIRGIESNGMICGLFELGVEEKTEENYNKGIYEASSDAKVGTDAMEYLGLDDTLFELDVHKHRNNDCYYHIGFAYEIASILNKKVTLPNIKFDTIKDDINDYLKLEVKTDKCPYYLARMVKNVKIGESPEFIKKRLNSVGIRSINNVVDISNYVMLEYGQPLHFFDYDKLGSNILVRDALNEEKITTLDSKERVLSTNDIVITDTKKPVCIAGVMGGLNTDIDNNTNCIVIESAIFDAISIRNTAANLNLKSEASIRYGKGLNYEYTNDAINRACELLVKYASGSVLSGTVIHDKLDKNVKKVSFKTTDINKILGISLTDKDVALELDKLGFSYTSNFEVTIPNRRLDIDPNINDIAEEIGRLYGYQNLVSTLPVTTIRKGSYVGDVKIRKTISKRLRSLGLNECKTYTLTSLEMSKLFNNSNNILLPNPMSSDKSVIRTSLIPSLLNVYEYNKARKVNDILLYEISKTYDSSYNEDTKISVLMKGNYISSDFGIKVPVDYYLIKGILENLLDYLGFKNRYSYEIGGIDLHPGISSTIKLDREDIGFIGRVHPSINKDNIYVFEISMNKLNKIIKPIKYKEASKYPSIIKDVSFITKLPSLDIINCIKKSGGRLLTDVKVFDVYESESIAFKLTFNDPSRTLTDDEVNTLFENIINHVSSELDCKVKSN